MYVVSSYKPLHTSASLARTSLMIYEMLRHSDSMSSSLWKNENNKIAFACCVL